MSHEQSRLRGSATVHKRALTSNTRQIALAKGRRSIGNQGGVIDLDWYRPWLREQRRKHPAFPDNRNDRNDRNPTHFVLDDADFDTLESAILKHIRTTRGLSIDDVIEHLDWDSLDLDASQSGPSTYFKRSLIFSILGWQSMVYQPEFKVCPDSSLAIYRAEPDSRLVYDTYTVPVDLCDRPLYVLLKGFGNLLPARSKSNSNSAAAVESSKAVASWTALYPDQMNAYLLHSLLRCKFRWVDTLALHLDYDKSTRTLSLFCFPSMCASQLQCNRCGAIFAFASTELDAADPRADESDIAHFLQEVLASFRLLFGQSAKSRRLFRLVYNESMAPFAQPDSLLLRLCMDKRQAGTTEGAAEAAACLPQDRRVYYAARDFPVLYERVELLANELKSAKPTTLRDLVRDRRDTLQFWTFWLVTIFGGASIVLSIVQAALAVIQILQAAGKI
ncbi:hypothetical protein CMQ_5730 [Grosmannia clavigera kw1407]|uniref:Uncharacterized protein n=1 Tax=Grosmannia clavigera (strain kw1407 / UAMH 11150) TaxID=655863 RepID=F0XSM8_GROCL|nr:uncharacterized protein CMQ_5730 [Grosmannia clavigera kw1407]EFW99309.1 hypothetical protein CMQ_5730 [Grosmannia clavigera kw1407]